MGSKKEGEKDGANRNENLEVSNGRITLGRVSNGKKNDETGVHH